MQESLSLSSWSLCIPRYIWGCWQWCKVLNFYMLFRHAGLSFVVDQLDCSSTDTACITIMHVPIWQGSCKPHSSSGTWLASAMVSFSCSGLLVSVQPYSLSVTYIDRSNASKVVVCGLLHLTDCFPDLVKATIRCQIGACRRIHFLEKKLVLSYNDKFFSYITRHFSFAAQKFTTMMFEEGRMYVES